jgi:malonyl-CoA decarboxylase
MSEYQGLRGVSFGNFLIKQVAEDLGRELPRLKAFATLSPVPGFRNWLAAMADASDAGPLQAELASIIAKLDVPHWVEDNLLSAEFQRQLAPLCAHYLLYAKQEQEPRDPASRFHLVANAGQA